MIIPTLNEEEQLKQLLPYLKNCCLGTVTEIIIVDGGSTDNTLNIANQYDLNILHSNQKCRATQMNLGVLEAQYDILYFIHADSRPPLTFPKDIHNAIQEGYEMGRYRTKFDKSNYLLKPALCNRLFITSQSARERADQILALPRIFILAMGMTMIAVKILRPCPAEWQESTNLYWPFDFHY